MARKTTQCIKIVASWTPDEVRADQMMTALNDTPAEGIRFSSGRITLKIAYPARYDDPAYTAKLTEHVQQVKMTLRMTGELHDFRVSAGAVEHADVIELPGEAK